MHACRISLSTSSTRHMRSFTRRRRSRVGDGLQELQVLHRECRGGRGGTGEVDLQGLREEGFQGAGGGVLPGPSCEQAWPHCQDQVRRIQKRRVIIDACLEEWGQQACPCSQRIVLPRPEDVVAMARSLKSNEPLVLADAFTHFPVAQQEQKHCVSLWGDEETLLIFVALFFGFKSAPLTMCRLSALLSRLLQSCFRRKWRSPPTWMTSSLAAG